MATRLISWMLAVVLAGIAGCATTADVLREKQEGRGAIGVYLVTAAEAWEIARAVFRWEGSGAVEEHRAEGYMLARGGTDWWAYPTLVGAWIEPVGERQTKVTVVLARHVETSLYAPLTETTFHRRFARAVELVKAGKPLPTLPP